MYNILIAPSFGHDGAPHIIEPQIPMTPYNTVHTMGKTWFGGVRRERFKVPYQALTSDVVKEPMRAPMAMSERLQMSKERYFFSLLSIDHLMTRAFLQQNCGDIVHKINPQQKV